jgi:ribonuclease PH
MVLTTAINAAMLALLATPSIPLRTTVIAIEAVRAQGVVMCHPNERQRQQATSEHVLAFDIKSKEVVFSENCGSFTLEEWDQVVEEARKDTAVEPLMRSQIEKLLGVEPTRL